MGSNKMGEDRRKPQKKRVSIPLPDTIFDLDPPPEKRSFWTSSPSSCSTKRSFLGNINWRIVVSVLSLFIITFLTTMMLVWGVIVFFLNEYNQDNLDSLLSAYAAQTLIQEKEDFLINLDELSEDIPKNHVLRLYQNKQLLFVHIPRIWQRLNPAFEHQLEKYPPMAKKGALIPPFFLQSKTISLYGGAYQIEVSINNAFYFYLTRYLERIWKFPLISASLISLIFSLMIFFISVKPQRELQKQLKEIAASKDLSRRLAQGKPSLFCVHQEINQMLEQMEKLFVGLENTLINIGHDLRTPLAKMSTILERQLMGLENPSHEVTQEALGAMIEEVHTLSSMLNNILDLIAVENSIHEPKRESFDLSKLLEEVVEIYQLIGNEKGIEILFKPLKEPTLLDSDPNRISQSVSNLLDNAVKFSDHNTRIEIVLERGVREITIEIKDEGEGIAQEKQAMVWGKLFRVESSRQETGFGLGLSIVKANIESLGGEIVLKSPLLPGGKGSSFTIHLPYKG